MLRTGVDSADASSDAKVIVRLTGLTDAATNQLDELATATFTESIDEVDWRADGPSRPIDPLRNSI